ncbi:putative dehydrogenase [Nonomuraea muscovyensis]|uniref:Putative dehydrogenase n=1 Tax=Nonomuraea muscovyensis TaxID=1124761 RepID=A0A7X0C805_9ACTN|nr:Gfo/Idh/MocA family oxidoreductase [Nonomuraea muscovyensis]MBB6348806.1 putative dehydrogenase [Nonomuraea muscovyensis]
MPSPLRVAVVGGGQIARHAHLPLFRELAEEVEVVAVVDATEELARAFADEFGLAHASADLDRTLAEVRPGLVVITSPPALHSAQAVAALRAGAWVWCEKPPCLSLAEYDAMLAAEREGGPFAAIVFQQRFGSSSQHLRRLIAEGALGDPYVAHCQTTWFRDDAYYAVPWRGRWESEGGGPAMGLGIHQMDLMLELLGDWSEVRAMAARLARDVETDDVTTALVRFSSGALATVVNSALSPRQVSHLRIDLAGATLELTHLYGYSNADWTYTPARDAAEIAWPPPEDVPSSHAAQLRGLLDDLRAGRRPRGSGEDGRRSLELVTAMYKAALTGRTVRAGEIGPGDPFYRSLHGDTPGWQPA